VTDSEVSKDLPEKPASNRDLKNRLRARLQFIGGALASIAAVGAVASGLLGYWNVWKTVRTDVLQVGQKTQREAAERPDIAPRLSIVVLPFANLSNDPEQDYFADGITTDLTTDLAQMPGAFVIGRGTAFTYKNKQIDLKTLGRDLGIQWAVQGAARRNRDQVRVNVSLTDLLTGRDVWSDRFDGDRTDLAALQDRITARLARSLNIELIRAESRRSEKSKNPDALDFSMRGWAKFYEPRSKEQNARAKDLFGIALQLDPDNVDAMIGRAWCLATNVILGWSSSVLEDKTNATDLVDKALSRSPTSALAHVVKGETPFDMGTLRRPCPNTTPRLKPIRIFLSLMAAKDKSLLFLGRRAKPSPPSRLPSASVLKILLHSSGTTRSAMRTCTYMNMKKPWRNAGARSA
jgi:adenylate cyclase